MRISRTVYTFALDLAPRKITLHIWIYEPEHLLLCWDLKTHHLDLWTWTSATVWGSGGSSSESSYKVWGFWNRPSWPSATIKISLDYLSAGSWPPWTDIPSLDRVPPHGDRPPHTETLSLDRDPSLDRDLSGQRAPRLYGKERAVRILLECNIVCKCVRVHIWHNFCRKLHENAKIVLGDAP